MANVVIVGYGEQGRSAFEYWFNKGNVVVICDQQTDIELPAGAIDKLGPTYLENLHEFDLIVRSPAVHPQTILDANPDHPEIKDKITSNTNEFFEQCQAPIIGVTGTKGKGTTSTLIARILEAAGKKVHLGGNIGTPPLDLLKNNISSDDIVVLELANFQLIDLKTSPHIAVCLLVNQEHLDWHKDTYEYIRAKRQIFEHQEADDTAIYNADNVYSTEITQASKARIKYSYSVPDLGQAPEFTDGAYVEGDDIKMQGETVAKIQDVQLLGRHNLQNVCAAIAATWDLIDHNKKLIQKVLQNFNSLPHRLELVREIGQIKFYNDSFSSAPDAAQAAIEAIAEPKVLIIGGFDRYLDLDGLASTVANHANDIRKVLLIGESAERVSIALKAAGFDNFTVSTVKTMPEIVNQATTLAQAGDAIVLSPGFPSFDMFKNFEQRGAQYREAVRSLK